MDFKSSDTNESSYLLFLKYDFKSISSIQLCIEKTEPIPFMYAFLQELCRF